jgi:hypothetical protein
MTCTHALDLIDIGPFADVPAAQLDALRLHVRTCASCAHALRAAEALAAGLGALAQPAPPPELTAAVIARIAEIEPVDEAPARKPSRSFGVSLVWVAGGAALMVGVGLAGQLGPNLRVIPSGTLPTTTTAALGLAAGLALYVRGLLGPVRSRMGS